MTDGHIRDDVATADEPGAVDGAALDDWQGRWSGLPVMIGLSDPADRSPNPETCPFFRSLDASGAVFPPVEAPDPANRCVAIDRATPQSVRQQELVCLTSGHVNCPRYLRGAVASHQAMALPVPTQRPSSPVLASAIVLVLSAAASVGFLFVRGGLALALPSASPGATPGASQVAIVTTPAPTVGTATASPLPSASPSTSPSPTPSPEPTIAPTPPATPAPTPPPAPRSNRYDVLVACPDAPACWIYTVRAGDNFQSIVNWFGVPYDTVVAMNPNLGDPSTIHAGDRIRMPPPTR